MANVSKFDKWYCHLTVESKERAIGCSYPECSLKWVKMSDDEKADIYIKMGGIDAHDHHKWNKGNGSLT